MENEPPDTWHHPPERAAMLAEVNALNAIERTKRLAIAFGKQGHIDDEVVVTLLLNAWRVHKDGEADSYAGVVVKRIMKQVRAHARKNPGWMLLGGGQTVIDDLCQSIVMAILQDKAQPCHAEQAFGNFVYRRCLDEAGKLYAKKHSAGRSLDDEAIEASTQDGEPVDSSAMDRSPEELLISLEEQFKELVQLEQIRLIVQNELPELQKIAFTFRYYGSMKIKSTRNEATVTSLMDISETTAAKYIEQATQHIISRLQK
jgi:hypothetical protein